MDTEQREAADTGNGPGEAGPDGTLPAGAIADQPTADPPTVDPPTVDLPTVDPPTVDQPTVDQPTVDQPTAEPPTVDLPTVGDDPTTGDPATALPTADGTTAGKPTADGTAADHPGGTGDTLADQPSVPATEPATGAATAAEEPAEQEPAAKEEERWQAFAPRPERPPGRLRRAAAAVGRVCVHEWTLAVVGSVALAVVLTWPTLRYPGYTLPKDLGDTILVAWLLAWPGHILLTDPTQLWHSNAFFPDRWSFAFTDSLLGYAPAGMIGNGPMDALIRYNIIYVLVHALAFLGAYALVRQLGAGRVGALVAGLAFGYAPWRLAQAEHLHVISTGGIALALAMLARGHGWSLRRGFRPERVRPGWIIAGWLVAAWQVTLGFGIGLPFVYVLALIALAVVLGWLGRRVARRRRHRIGSLLTADLVGGTVFSAVTVLMALPYLVVLEQHPQAQRSMAEVALFSPPPQGYFIASPHTWLWGDQHTGARELLSAPSEMALLPGYTLIALGVAGLFISVWSWRARIGLALGVAASVALGLGTSLFDGILYQQLYDWLPGWDALRTPGRLIIWTTLLLAVLAAGALTALAVRAHEFSLARGSPTRGPWLRVLTAVPLLLVLAESVGPLEQPVAPPQPEALATAEGPLLVLPSEPATDRFAMWWTTDRFVPLVNGSSGFMPETLAEVREVTASFPDPGSVSYLRALGVETVVVLADRVVGTEWEGALSATGQGLGISREEIGRSVVFDLNP